jgi:hypothetical protein
VPLLPPVTYDTPVPEQQTEAPASLPPTQAPQTQAPQAAWKQLAETAVQRLQATVESSNLRPGVDYSCNDPSYPGACVAKSARAATEYQKLQQALVTHFQATMGTAAVTGPNAVMRITGALDGQTKLALRRILPDSKALPYSNLPVTPWLFREKIEALPKVPGQVAVAPTGGGLKIWMALGVGGLALALGGWAIARR